MADGELAKPGMILVRQRGTKIRPGKNVARGSDDTLFALAEGIVKYAKKKVIKFYGKLEWTTLANILPKK